MNQENSMVLLKTLVKQRTDTCKNKNGKIIEEKSKIVERWEEHFGDLLGKNNNPINIDQDAEIEHMIQEATWSLQIWITF